MTIAASSPQARPHRLWIWVAVGLLALALVTILAAPQYPGGSSYSRAPGGYSQWYAFMKQQGHSIQRWQKPYSQLTSQLKGRDQVLIQISDQSETVLQSPEMLQWVEQGNTLIFLSWAGKVTGAPFRSDLPTPQGQVRIETSRRYRVASAERKEASKLQDKFGAVVWSRPQGQGQIIAGTYPWIAANVHAQGGNFRALEALAGNQRTIWIDEWLHGHRDAAVPRTRGHRDAADPDRATQRQALWRYLSRQPLIMTVGQSAVLLLLLLWGQNQRFGPLLRRAEPPRNSSEQYIQALATTLKANGSADYVLSMLVQLFRQRLQTQLGFGSGSGVGIDDDAIAQRWATVTGRPSQELLELLQIQSQNRLNESALLRWVQQSDAIVRELTL